MTTRFILGVGAAMTVFGLGLGSSRATAEPQQSLDSRTAMIEALPAMAPHPSLGNEAHVFDRFIGTWDCDYTFYLNDGTKRKVKGEIEFGWILDGRAIQDIWISYPKEAGKERGIGTTVSFSIREIRLGG
jgi:hypothetical protein